MSASADKKHAPGVRENDVDAGTLDIYCHRCKWGPFPRDYGLTKCSLCPTKAFCSLMCRDLHQDFGCAVAGTDTPCANSECEKKKAAVKRWRNDKEYAIADRMAREHGDYHRLAGQFAATVEASAASAEKKQKTFGAGGKRKCDSEPVEAASAAVVAYTNADRNSALGTLPKVWIVCIMEKFEPGFDTFIITSRDKDAYGEPAMTADIELILNHMKDYGDTSHTTGNAFGLLFRGWTYPEIIGKDDAESAEVYAAACRIINENGKYKTWYNQFNKKSLQSDGVLDIPASSATRLYTITWN